MKIKTKPNSCLRVMLLLVTVLCLQTTAAAGYLKFEVDEIVYVSYDDCTATVERVDKGGDVVIPSTVTYNDVTYTVTCIYNRAFNDYYSNGLWFRITSISIPSSVTSIDFYSHSDIKSLFSHCEALTRVTVASGNPIYDSRDNCNAIIETASNTLCAGFKNTVIPNSVTSIGSSAFSYCSGLTNLTIPNSVTSIGSSAFSYCSGLTTVTIPNSVTSIGSWAFYSCSGLTTVTIPNSVTSIPDYAFYNCSGLTTVTIPNSVTSIGEMAFWDCSELANVDLPSSVTEIGSSAFAGTKIVNDQQGGVAYVGNWIVQYGYLDVPIREGTVGIAATDHILWNGHSVNVTDLVIPNSVLYIGDYAFGLAGSYFDQPLSIKTIVIGDSVKTIGKGSFYTGCRSRLIADNVIEEVVDLQSITCLAKIPPKARDAFAYDLENPIFQWYGTDYAIYHRVPLYVPKKSVDAYKNDEEWGRFNTIIGIDVNDHLDVNGDGEVTIGDVGSIINVIINSTYTSNLIIYDVNGDSEVTVADINTIIDAILGN